MVIIMQGQMQSQLFDPGILRSNVKVITPPHKNHCPVAHVDFPALSRLGYAGGLLHLHSAPLGGGQEAHGEHARLLLRHQRAAAAAALPWRHRPHRWEGNNVTSTHSNRADFSRYFQNLTHSSTCLVPLHWCCYASIISKCKSMTKSSRAHPVCHFWKCSDISIRAVAPPPMPKFLSNHY